MAHFVGDVVVVTGAAGFLGIKICELLNERGSNIQEIRGFDVVREPPLLFTQDAKHTKRKLNYSQGDICNYDEVSET